MKTLVFLTAYNEEKTIGDVLDRLIAVTGDIDHPTEILVVDDGSEDSTAAIAATREVTLIEHPRNLGPGAATQTGYKYAVRKGFDVTVRMDADGQHLPEEVPKLLDPIADDEADIVIGSRYKSETGYETSTVRDSGIRFYSWLVSFVTGHRVYDITSGFRAVRIEMGEHHAENLPRGIIAIDRGLREGLSEHRIKEVPVKMEQREHGRSYLKARRLVAYPLYPAYSFVGTLLQWNRNRQ